METIKGNYKTAEFLACVAELVSLINKGRLSLNTKLRGSTKDKVAFSEARRWGEQSTS